MSGTKAGGLKAAQKNLAGNPNFYAEIEHVQDEQNLVNVDFDEIWGYDVRDVSESDSAGDVEIIKAEDIL